MDFINHHGAPHIVEIDTVPGFSEPGRVPVDLLVDDALAQTPRPLPFVTEIIITDNPFEAHG